MVTASFAVVVVYQVLWLPSSYLAIMTPIVYVKMTISLFQREKQG